MGRFRGCDLCGRQIIPSSIYWRVTLKDGTELKVCDQCALLGCFYRHNAQKMRTVDPGKIKNVAKVRFKSRVEGLDDEWNESQSRCRPKICSHCGRDIPLSMSAFDCNIRPWPVRVCGSCIAEDGGINGYMANLLLENSVFYPPLE